MAWPRCLHLLVAAILYISLLSLSASGAQPVSCKTDRKSEIFKAVALGLSERKLVLATPADACKWRYRVLALASNDLRIVDATLSATGTKIAVLFQHTEHHIYDLTTPEMPQTLPVHSLPNEVYELCDEDRKLVRLRDDDQELPSSHVNTCPQSRELDLKERFAVAPRLVDSLGLVTSHELVRSWKILIVVADPRLYAPVLEFAAEEKVFPSSTKIWGPLAEAKSSFQFFSDLKPNATKAEREERELQTYLTSSLKDNDRTVYYRSESYPGCWLFEYWTYYTFDVGGVSPHPHDTEHVFVEVDKLGGRIVGVLAQAHTEVTPNNLYSALLRGAEPSNLPVYVIVERAKHALSPDINHDLHFTTGVDVNVFAEESQVWGVRDAIGQSDAHMMSYASSMTLPRDSGHAWAEENFGGYFGRERSQLIGFRYHLMPFPEDSHKPDPRNTACPGLTATCAEYELNHHSDAIHPSRIYKKWVFPYQEVRLGYANIEGGSSFSVGYVSAVNKLPGLGKLSPVPLPGRIAFEVFALPLNRVEIKKPNSPSPSGPAFPIATGVRFQYGVQYEKSISNLFGYFGGYFRREIYGQSGCAAVRCLNTEILPGNFYHLGFFFELPYFKDYTFHLGPVFSTPGGISGVYFRFSYSIWSRRGRTTFGNPRFENDRTSPVKDGSFPTRD